MRTKITQNSLKVLRNTFKISVIFYTHYFMSHVGGILTHFKNFEILLIILKSH